MKYNRRRIFLCMSSSNIYIHIDVHRHSRETISFSSFWYRRISTSPCTGHARTCIHTSIHTRTDVHLTRNGYIKPRVLHLTFEDKWLTNALKVSSMQDFSDRNRIKGNWFAVSFSFTKDIEPEEKRNLYLFEIRSPEHRRRIWSVSLVYLSEDEKNSMLYPWRAAQEEKTKERGESVWVYMCFINGLN